MFVLHPTASLILEDICKGTKTNGDNYKCAYDNEGGGCVLENVSVTRYGYYHRGLDKVIYTDWQKSTYRRTIVTVSLRF